MREWTIGDQVRVLNGPFRDFGGAVCGKDGQDLIVQVDVFGRTTPVTLSPTDIGPIDLADGSSSAKLDTD